MTKVKVSSLIVNKSLTENCYYVLRNKKSNKISDQFLCFSEDEKRRQNLKTIPNTTLQSSFSLINAGKTKIFNLQNSHKHYNFFPLGFMRKHDSVYS